MAWAFGPVAKASSVYVTGGGSIYTWDTATNAVSLLTTVGTTLDSLILDPNNNLIYSRFGDAKIGLYNFATNSNSVIATVGSGVADLVLEPGGNTVLVSESATNTIDRLNLSTDAVTSFNVGVRPDGLAYDNNGHLYAVLGLNEIVQLNPLTLAVIATTSTLNAPDGLSFDAQNGMLYAGSDAGGFYTVTLGPSGAPLSPTFTNLGLVVDGIAAGGNFLYLGVRNTGAVQYNLTTNTLTRTSPGIPGADDLALGPAPEPGTIFLLAPVLIAFGFRRKLGKVAQT
jgi:hypothetical protein